MPANIGRSGPVIADSSPVEILSVMTAATANEIVRLDLRGGNEWWVTRVFALSIGAVRAGSPKALVFVGLRSGIEGTFLGWAEPSALLQTLMSEIIGNTGRTYEEIYQRAATITKQVATFTDPVGLSSTPQAGYQPLKTSLTLPYYLTRYLNDTRYSTLGDAALEQILMDQLATNNMEATPDRLTLGRLQTLFAHCLYTDAMDLGSPTEKQIAVFLESRAPYLALIRNGTYEALVGRTDLERVIMRQLFEQATQGTP